MESNEQNNDVTFRPETFIELTIDRSFDFFFYADSIAILGIAVLLVVIIGLKVLWHPRKFWRSFEINEAEFGLGDQKIRFTPNVTDQQIAYKIWVELSTRKIGIPIDTEDDVISEIYDSWFNFFSVTRELVKDVPVQKFRRRDTEKIVRLSIDVLNDGIRPHLTKWQAKFRRWYEIQLADAENTQLSPQEIQGKYPQFEHLQRDLLAVNTRLINYRKKMYEIIKAQ